MLLFVGPGRGRKSLEGRPCMAVMSYSRRWLPQPKERNLAAPATAPTATARVNSLAQTRKRPGIIIPSSGEPGIILSSEGDGYVDLVSGLYLFKKPEYAQAVKAVYNVPEVYNAPPNPHNAAPRGHDLFSSLCLPRYGGWKLAKRGR